MDGMTPSQIAEELSMQRQLASPPTQPTQALQPQHSDDLFELCLFRLRSSRRQPLHQSASAAANWEAALVMEAAEAASLMISQQFLEEFKQQRL